MKNKLFAAAVGLLMTAVSVGANATVFTFSNSSAAFAAGPYGTVTLTQQTVSPGVTDVLVQVSLASGYAYNLAGNAANKNDFAFTLATGAVFSNVTAGYTLVNGPLSTTPTAPLGMHSIWLALIIPETRRALH